MDKYEYRVKTEQMLEHMENKRYKKAMEIADTIDWRRVKNPSMLNSVSEIYEYNGEFQKSRDVLFMAYDRAPNSRKTVYRLGTLALKINDIEEASDCYEEFVKLAPKDPNQFILKYKILKARRAPLAEQIDALEEFKKAEYIEKWAYELARLYDLAGMTAECLEECDDLILWFSEGRYVYQAMELKMKYKPLTPLQQERYESQKSGMGGISVGLAPDVSDGTAPAASEASDKNESVEDLVARMMSSVGGDVSDATNPDMKPVAVDDSDETEDSSAGFMKAESGAGGDSLTGQNGEKALTAQEGESAESKVHGGSNILRTVKGATLAEALRNGFAVANGIDLEPKTKAIDKRDEDLRITGQMKIEEILMEWEAKQKENAKAIDSQRKKDEEARAKEKLEAEKRREEEARRIEKQQRAAEEARRHAEQRAAEEKRRLAARKAEEERILAEQKAEEERRQAILQMEEEERKLEQLAARKTVQDLGDGLEEQPERDTDRLYGNEDGMFEELSMDGDVDEAVFEDADGITEEASYEEAGEADEEASYGVVSDELAYEYDDLDEDLEEYFADQEELQESTGMTADLQALMEELEADLNEESENGESWEEAYEEGEGRVSEDELEEESYEEAAEDILKASTYAGTGEGEIQEEAYEEAVREEFEESYEEAGGDEFEDESYEEIAEDEFEDESYEEIAEDEFEDESYEEIAEDELEEEAYEEAGEEEFEEEAYEKAEGEEFEEESYEEAAGDEFEDEAYEEGEPVDEADAAGDESYDESYEEVDAGAFRESYEEADEDEFDEGYIGDYEDDSYDDYEEDEFEEDEPYEQPVEDELEDEFEEEEIPVAEEPEPVKPARKKKSAKAEKKPEKAVKPAKVESPEELTIEEPTEEEIQKRIKKGKGGVPFDTGFVVTGRYDLSATSEIGLRAGLTEEQKKLFSYFVPVRGMSEQIVEVLDNDRREKREGTSRTGNIIVMGQKGSGKTVLAVDIVKAIQKQRNLKQGKVAIVTGESLNKKELTNIIQKLRGGAIIIEKAGKLNTRTIKELNRLMDKKTGELLVVLEDQKKPLERIFMANPPFKKKFTSKLELPAFINDELVTFGQTYAKESGYKLDEMGILALYSRIDVMQREDHAVTVAEVKEIMDEAIEHSKKANVKHFARRVFGKGTDDSDRIILKEDDFRI